MMMGTSSAAAGDWGPSYYVGDPNMTVRITVLNSLICPSDPSPNIDTNNPDDIERPHAAGSSYVGNMGDNCLACSDPVGGRLGVVIICNDLNLPCRLPQLGHARVTDPQTNNGSPAGSGIFWAVGRERRHQHGDRRHVEHVHGRRTDPRRHPVERLGGRQRDDRLDGDPPQLQAQTAERRRLDPTSTPSGATTPAGPTSRWPTAR